MFYLLLDIEVSAIVSVSDNMVMEVVSAAVSGNEVAGNWIKIVYTESPLLSEMRINVTTNTILKIGWLLERFS